MENLKTENKFEGLYIIGYGLSGGFGGIKTFEVIQVDTEEEAEDWAFESACEEYERYVGHHGLRTLSQIMEEDEIEDDEEAMEVYNQEREMWIAYNAIAYSKDNEKKAMMHSYHNPYKEITGDCED